LKGGIAIAYLDCKGKTIIVKHQITRNTLKASQEAPNTSTTIKTKRGNIKPNGGNS
jgi:hypothetical protein